MPLLGIDVGTSSLKVIIASESGEILGEGASEYPVSRPRPGWSEQDPELWWGALLLALPQAIAAASVRASDIRAVGLSGQMHGSVLLSRETVESRGVHGAAIRPALLWNDQRTASQCERIESLVGGRRALVDLVGNAALTGFTLPKLLWVREHEPETASRIASFMLPKDYIGFRLTGVCATDVGDASGTLLLDPEARAWSDRVLGLFGVDREMLPTLHESAQVIGGVTRWAAEQLGLNQDTPVIAGSGDNQAGALGAGIVGTGQVLATLGTSGVIYAHADHPRRDAGETPASTGRLHTMCAADGTKSQRGNWSLTGCMLSAAGSLQWARDTIAPGVPFDRLIEEASSVEPGSRGLLFMPHLAGERCPYPDPAARGAWIGLTARHTRAHLIRAVIEGITMTMAQILDIVRGAGVEVRSVRLGGGGARSRFWRELQADLYGVPVATTNTEQGPAFGAAMLAGVGIGVWPDVASAASVCVHESERIEPESARAQRYSPAREAFAGLHAGLQETFRSLGDIDRDSQA
ncbi:MAG: xylulokinase [Phycisphaeraceae bacterium]|nr:MAG: xylulokinase [Phycisphaeraceae bacterium]